MLGVIRHQQNCVEHILGVLIPIFVHVLRLNLFSATGNYLCDRV
jgi:hypothetical protein